MKKSIKAWGGFIGDRLCREQIENSYSKTLAVFDNRADANTYHNDVRQLTISFASPARPKGVK